MKGYYKTIVMKTRINTRLNKSLVIDDSRVDVINNDIIIIPEKQSDAKRIWLEIKNYKEESLMAPGTPVLHADIDPSLGFVKIEPPLRDDRPERYPWIE